MKLKYEKRDHIPEALQEYYIEKGEGWYLEITEELTRNFEVERQNYEAQLSVSKIERAALEADDFVDKIDDPARYLGPLQ